MNMRQTVAGALALITLACFARSAYRYGQARRDRVDPDDDVERWEQEGGSVDAPQGPLPSAP